MASERMKIAAGTGWGWDPENHLGSYLLTPWPLGSHFSEAPRAEFRESDIFTAVHTLVFPKEEILHLNICDITDCFS